MSTKPRCMLVPLFLAGTAHAGASLAAHPPIPRVCPGAQAWAVQQAAMAKSASRRYVASDQPLHDAILAAADEDRRQRQAILDDTSNSALFKQMQASDAKHLLFLQSLAPDGIIPSPSIIGSDGMDALLLLIEHATSDIDFQRSVLPHLLVRVQAGEVDWQAYAMLLDRVLTERGEGQVYGTQVNVAHGAIEIAPVQNQGELDARRKQAGLMPMKDYECMLSMTYRIPIAGNAPP